MIKTKVVARLRKNISTKKKPGIYSVFAIVNGLFSKSYEHLDTFEADTKKEARASFDYLKKKTTLPWKSMSLVRHIVSVDRGDPCI